MSTDQSDGPDNSIWRAGSTLEKERTLSTWIAETPLQGYPRIYIKLANPGEESKNIILRLMKDSGTGNFLNNRYN